MSKARVFEHWSPVTHDFGLIQAPLEQVVTALRNWHRGIGITYRRREIVDGLGAAFTALLPLSSGYGRRLYLRTQSDWTACFQNGIQGSDPFPAMSTLAGKLQVQSMRVCSSPPDAVFFANIWELYAPASQGGGPLNHRRVVCAANDGGRWVFHTSGEPFPFESLDAYEAQRKRERFTRTMIAEYLAHFGIRLFDDSFFLVDEANPAVLLDEHDARSAWPGRGRSRDAPSGFTLEQVKAGVPWKR